MKPTLLLLSGPPSAGKSTLAQRYIDEHPMALKLDIDLVWFMMGKWQECRPHSTKQKYKLALRMAETHLRAGYDVVVAQDLETAALHRQFEKLAHKHNAHFSEIVLTLPFKQLLKRFIARGKASGHKTGYRPGGIMDTEGNEQKLKEMHEATLRVAKLRKGVVLIESLEGQPEHTYAQIMKILSANADM